MMHLLELPIEVFRAILEQMVITLGDQKSASLQLVNKFFAKEVVKAVCATRILTTDAWDSPWIPYYIRSLSLAPEAVDHYLLRTVKQTTQQLLLSYSQNEHESQRQVISLGLSRLACRYRDRDAILGPVPLVTTTWSVPQIRPLPKSNPWYIQQMRSYEFQESTLRGTGQKSTAAEHVLSAAAYLGDLSSVRSLLSQGIDVNVGSNVFGMPLWAASCGGHLDLVRFLLCEGADPSDGVYPRTKEDQDLVATSHSTEDIESNITGQETPLVAAARKGHEQIVRLLLQPEFQISRSNYNYRAAILYATEGGSASLMRFLIEAGDANNGNSFQYLWDLALIGASWFGNAEMAGLALDKGARTDVIASKYHFLDVRSMAIDHAAFNGHADVVHVILQRDPKIVIPHSANIPILKAAKRGFVRTVQVMMDYGAEDLKNLDRTYPNSLNEAARYGQINVVRFLLEKGFHHDLDAGLDDALEFALEEGHEDVAQLLREYTST